MRDWNKVSTTPHEQRLSSKLRIISDIGRLFGVYIYIYIYIYKIGKIDIVVSFPTFCVHAFPLLHEEPGKVNKYHTF